MAKVCIGNFKGPQGDKGDKGDTGAKGATGQRGSRWSEGTKITGTLTTATVIAAVSALMGWLGVLAVPVLLLVGCNIIDYATGLCAVKYRNDSISSYKSIKGIKKKVCMWLLVVVGAFIDVLIQYAVECAGIGLAVPFVVATVVAVWLVVNEIISILENMIDIGVKMPPFLLPILKYIKKQVEDKTAIDDAEKEAGGND